MKDEIKEIIQLIGNCCYHGEISEDKCKKYCNYITNLQEENERLKQDYINVKNYILLQKVDSEVEDKALLYNIELENINKKKYEDYKSRNEKAINEVIRVLQIILEQPSENKLDDLWIINKLEGIQTLLQGEDKDVKD